MTTKPGSGPVRPRRPARWLVTAAAGFAVLAVVVGVVVWRGGGVEPAAASYPDVPSIGSPGPAVCPPVWEDGAPAATRKGNLVPPGAVEALLCAYPFRAPDPFLLGSVHPATTTVDSVVNLLNQAPDTRPPDVECLLGGATSHNVVLSYPDRQPAVVHIRNCAADQSGAVRYEVGLGRLTALFGVGP